MLVLHCLGCWLVTSWLAVTCHASDDQIYYIRADDGQPIKSRIGVPGVNATFDYVVLGGGTAGLAIAARLAQDPSQSVAVIEAGGFYQIDNGNDSIIPAYCYKSANATSLELTNSLIDWMYTTEPQSQLNDRTFHFVRGKTLGGTSARNYLNYNRATVGAMQKWAREVDDESYLWQNMLQFYQKSVEYNPPNYAARGPNATNNDDVGAFMPGQGPLRVSYPGYFDPAAAHFPAAFEQLGLQHLSQGVNLGHLLGYGSMTTTISWPDGFRSSSQTSFLNLAFAETSLVAYQRTMTERIMFNATRATGVRASANNQTFTINARKEVILSAGVIGSPQVLMVSGVGPKEVLEKYDIALIADRPGVGQNLQDSPMLGLLYDTDFPKYSMPSAEQEFHDHGTGPLTDSGSDLMAFDKVSDKDFVNVSASTIVALNASFPADWPEAEFMVGTAGAIFGALLTTFSRGSVSIASPHIRAQPIINPGWLTDPRDQELVVALFRYLRKLETAPSVAEIVTGNETSPGSKVQTDNDILEWIKATSYSIVHGSCTCKMGKTSDPLAVVDSDAKVLGTLGLRVVDASAFPFLPPGQPQATVYALAEKIAARILAGH